MTQVCNNCGGPLRSRYPHVVDPQTRETFEISACERCGLGHTLPQPEDLGRYYGPAYHGGRHGFTARYCLWRRERFVFPRTGPSGRLLDVGCGDGSWLLTARDHGWQTVGTELAPKLARENGLEVYETLDDVKGEFDVATMWHSLEHMRDPHATVAKIAALTKPGGWIFIAVPDAEGLQAQLFGEKWFHLDVPRHLFHFGARSLRQLLLGAGYSVQHVWHQELELDLFGWAQSALNVLLPDPNVFFYRLTGRPTPAGAGQVAASFALGSAFSAAAIPALPAGALTGRGGTLVMAATKGSP
jgi:SAM-dependent methyltransferase